MNKKSTVDLIHGPILPALSSFALPILLSNIFQQLYNTADILIVGRFLGSSSLAAVGATTAIFDLIIGFALGVGNGMGVVIARYYGARNFSTFSRSGNTSVINWLVKLMHKLLFCHDYTKLLVSRQPLSWGLEAKSDLVPLLES